MLSQIIHENFNFIVQRETKQSTSNYQEKRTELILSSLCKSVSRFMILTLATTPRHGRKYPKRNIQLGKKIASGHQDIFL